MFVFSARTIVYMCIVVTSTLVLYTQLGYHIKKGFAHGLLGSLASGKEIAISRTRNTHNQKLQSDKNFSDTSSNLYKLPLQTDFINTPKEEYLKPLKEDLEFEKEKNRNNWSGEGDIGSGDIGVGISTLPQMHETLSAGNGFQEPNGGESITQMHETISHNEESIHAFDPVNGLITDSNAVEGPGYPEIEEEEEEEEGDYEGSTTSEDDEYGYEGGSGMDASTNGTGIGDLIDDYEAEDDDDGDYKDEGAEDIQTENEEEFMTRMEERFKSRKKMAEKGCHAHNNPVNSITRTKKRFLYYSYKYNLIVCAVAKTGASTWKSHLLAMKGISSNGINVHSGYWEKKIKAKSILGKSGMSAMLPKASKVLTVRHPLDRLVSAYRDKFNGGKPTSGGLGKARYFWLPAGRYLRKSLKKDGKYQISFADFLKQVVINHWSGGVNAHWSKMYGTCSPCHISYDYIMKTESYSEDLAYIVKKLGIKEVDASYRRHGLGKPSTESTLSSDNPPLRASTLHYYKNIHIRVLDNLEKIYHIDMDMFGFEFPSDMMNAINKYRAKNK